MPETPEPLATILAEMRDFAKPLRVGGDLCSNVALPATISIWADRIEAALSQERSARAALEEPPRNCDLYEDGPEALFAYKETIRDGEEVRVPWLLDWLFARTERKGADHA